MTVQTKNRDRLCPNSRWSRREILCACLVGTTGTTLSRPQTEKTRARDKDKNESGFIDAHAHIWTRDVHTFPLAKGKTVQNLDPPSFTAEELMQVTRPEGVSRVVLIQHYPYHGFDNSYLTDTAQRYPGKFKVVGMVNEQRPRPDAVMRQLLSKHVTAFRITPSIRGRDTWLDGPGMAAMWECAAETRQAMCCLINPWDLTAVDGMCQKYPDTPVVIDHFSRIGADGSIGLENVKRLCKLARHQNTSVKISAYYALGKKKPPYLDLIPMIRHLYEAFGPQRMMWASDAPYQLQHEHSYRASISLVRDQLDFISNEDRQWLLTRTAERVYFA